MCTVYSTPTSSSAEKHSEHRFDVISWYVVLDLFDFEIVENTLNMQMDNQCHNYVYIKTRRRRRRDREREREKTIEPIRSMLTTMSNEHFLVCN
jgi:hypothetical protein